MRPRECLGSWAELAGGRGAAGREEGRLQRILFLWDVSIEVGDVEAISHGDVKSKQIFMFLVGNSCMFPE